MPDPSPPVSLVQSTNRSRKVTWSPTYFSPPDLLVYLQIDYPDDDNNPSAETGSSTRTPLPASQGFYPWTIPADFLSSRPGNPARYNVTFVLKQVDSGAERVGPTVFITAEAGSGGSVTPGGDGSGGGRGTNVVAIAVPVVVVGVLLLLGALCFASWRKHGRLPLVGGAVARRRSSGGYGVRQSRSERTGGVDRGGDAAPGQWGGAGGADNKSETDVGIQLTDRDSWSPTGRSPGAAPSGGRNVFREELDRQAQLR